MTTRKASSLYLVLLLTSALFVSISFITAPEPVLAAGGLTLTPNTGPPGAFVTISDPTLSWTYAAGTSCKLSGSAPGLVASASCTIGPGGSIFGGFTVGSVPGGAYQVFAAVGSDMSAGTAFTVVAGIFLSPTHGPPSIHVTITGGGFSTTGACTIGGIPVKLGTAVCSVTGTARTITVGSGFDVDPTAAAGSYTVMVTRPGPPADTPTAPFDVIIGPSVVVSPLSGPRGLTVSVSGSGFSTSDTSAVMTFTLQPGPPGGALWTGTIKPTLTTSGPFKTASATFTVAPSATPSGSTYRITIQGSSGDLGDTSITGDFVVAPDPVIAFAPAAAGPAGFVVAVSSPTPFGVTDVGSCTMSSSPTTKLIPAGSAYVCQIDAFGSLTGQFIVPSNAPGGSYFVTVKGSKGDSSAPLSFLVQPAVTFSVTEGYPPITAPATPGTAVTVTGTGFSSADTTCTITSGDPSLGIDFVSCTVTGSSGQLTAHFNVKAGSWSHNPAVAEPVTVTGSPGADSPSVPGFPLIPLPTMFTVDARIVLSPTSGSAGTTVTYAGSGFTNTPNPTGVCTPPPDITGTPVAAPTTCFQDVHGNVWGQFQVPSPAPVPGSYLVTYTDTSGAPAASAPFSVTGVPSVSLSTYTGPTGTSVTVTGSGFNSADTSVQIVQTFPVAPPAPYLFSPTPLTCTVSGGSIAAGCTFTVSSTAPGVATPGYTLQIKGNTGDSANANFLVTATFFASPNNGGVNTANVHISGTGYFAGGGFCMVLGNPWYEDPTPLANLVTSTCNVDPNGVLTGNINIVAGAALGAHAIGISSAGWVPQGIATATFTVTQPALTLTPNTGSGGDTIQFSGIGFSTGDTVCTLTTTTGVDTIQSYSCTVTGGTATGSFIVKKAGNPAEVKTLTLAGNLGDSAAASFTVVPQISDTLTPGGSASNRVRVGDTVTVTGSNFAVADAPPGPGAQITGASVTGPPVACPVAADYTINCPFTVLVTFAGLTDLITVTGLGSGLTATATLYIMPHTVTLTPTSGALGTSVSVTATGFTLADTCPGTVLDASLVVTGWTCSASSGTITGSFVAGGAQPPATYTLSLTGLPDTDVGTATFTVEPGISLLPNSGRPATSVLVTGTNFVVGPPGDTGCSISSTPGGLISSPLCAVAGGAMSGSFTVAAGTSGAYTVNVAGTTGDIGHATFNVPPGPSLILAPDPVNPGSAVTASGSGYLGTSCLLQSSPSGLFSGSASCSISAGTLAGSFTVASGASGSYTVTVSTNAGSGDSASADLSVAAGPTPTLTLTPTSGVAGTVVTGTGTGFTADTTCILSAAPTTILSSASCTITSGGSFTVGFTASTSAPAGTYAILAIGNTGKAASATFTITAPSGIKTLDLSPSSGRAGTAITVSGSNYAGTSCSLTSSPSGLLSSASCSIVSGTLSGGFTVASGALAGYYTVTVTTDVASDTMSAGFTVPSPTFSLSPDSGPAGTAVTVSGSNYAGTSCSLSSSPGGLFTSPICAISASGVLTGAFTVVAGAHDGYTVTVTTSVLGETASASFTVPLPTLIVSPSSGTVGTAVSISGSNYAGTSCSLSSSPGGLLSSQTCLISSGTLSGGFTVASGAPVGSYTLTVTTTFPSDTTNAIFTVTTSTVGRTLTLNPSSGAVGTVVTVSGLNYAGTSCSLTSSPSGLLSSPTCSISSGTLSGGFTVASDASPGGYTVTVTTDIASDTMSAGFTVTGTTAYTPPKCVIATATFGSEASPAVQFLRSFRDNLVLRTKAGSAFMEVFNAWYYSFSPTVAQFIANNDPIRAPVRVLLYPLLGVLSISAFTYSLFSASPEFGVVIAGLVASSLIGLVYLTPFAFLGMRALTKRRRIGVTGVAKGSLLLLAVALALLVAGELAGSFLLLAAASSAVVLTCIIAAPTMAVLAVLRAKPQ